MEMVQHFRSMARNNAWSNYRLHKACAGLTEEEFNRKRVSFFPSLPLTMLHILEVDWLYLDQLEATPTDRDAMDYNLPYRMLAELTPAQQAMDLRLIAYCERLTAQTIDAPVVIRRADGYRPVNPASAVLSHLFVHQIHHRGQVHAMLAGASVPPPQLDEFFLIEDQPLRAPDLAALELP
ncbi:DinB family protein [Hypericibacter sp.]|uniref:DinB family protein n=1 Tax=Hypericibacter sp. TaxID=2705401 RepID=UPI003D6CA01A